ncbi:MFS transporter [Acanthopleuribacter pedis]|uniref:MFS transporter n=1 Tax=Acanthopleuribacter pedis TaxID=442870 RepID=A0A8J7QMD3_9BACT|nr:MFS transporter [Acanthopleuribacter pedis]MBO1320650.1 MFS transporter [Acanthopleuribacter pedis]
MSASYFTYFLLFGLILPFLSPVLIHQGYTKTETGMILSLFYFFSAVIPILGARLSDRFLSADRLMKFCAWTLVLVTAPLWYFSREPSWLYLLFFGIMGAARSPVVSLQDTLAMQVSKNDPRLFARRRLVGSIGFIVAAVLGGWAMDHYGLESFYPLLMLTTVMFALSTITLPTEQKADSRHPRAQFWQRLTPGFWLWIAAMSAHWLAFAPFHYGFSLFLEEVHIAPTLIGWYWSFGVIAEIVAFFTAGWFFRRWSYRHVLFMALGANLVRWLLIGIFDDPWLIAATQALHGIGFALYYSAAMQALAAFAGDHDRASFQGLFSSVVGGGASIIGNTLSGWIHEMSSMQMLFLIAVPLQALSIMLLWINPLNPSRDEDPSADAILPETQGS